MEAAIVGAANSLTAVLAYFMARQDNRALINKLLHESKGQNNRKAFHDFFDIFIPNSRTLPYFIAQSKKTLIGPLGMIMQLERDFHMINDEDRPGFRALVDCYRQNHGSSPETLAALRTFDMSKPHTISRIWMRILLRFFLIGLVIPLCLWTADIATDLILRDHSNITNILSSVSHTLLDAEENRRD